ncbi:MAG: helix-turn-helix domain-containing protein [Planctomycetota bacterium]
MERESLRDRLEVAIGERTNRRIADLTNTSPETVRRYLAGHAPSVDFIARLCGVLGLNVDWLLTGRGPMRVAEMGPDALRRANPTDLLTRVASAIEQLDDRVDRLERYAQGLEVMLRTGPKQPRRAETAAAATATSVEAKPISDAAVKGQSGAQDHGQQAVGGARARAEWIADALPQRPRPDAG